MAAESDSEVVHRRELRLRTYLFVAFGLLSLAVLSALGVVLSVRHASQHRLDAGQRLETIAASTASAVDHHLTEHLSATVALAKTLGRSGAPIGDLELDQYLADFRSVYPSFLTVIVAEPEGWVIAADPQVTSTGEPLLSSAHNVKDRDYFRQPMATGDGYISETFRGRGFGDDPIIALSAPIRSPQGSTLGIVEASLNLSTFRTLEGMIEDLRQASLLLVDSKECVVYASPAMGIDALTSLSADPLLVASRDAGRHFRFQAGDTDAFVGRATTGSGWTVLVQLPVRVFNEEAIRDIWFTVFYILLAVGLSLVLSHWLAARMTRPLDNLLAEIRAFRSRKEETPAVPGGGMPYEVRQLLEEFRAMTGTLADSHRRLRGALAKEEALRHDLENERMELESEVERRREIQQELQVMNRQLEIARDIALEGNRAKSSFLSNMSHELRTPLNAILGFSAILTEKLEGRVDDKLVQLAINTHTAGRQMLSLVEQLIEIARIETGSEKLFAVECDPREVLARAISFAERPAAKNRNRMVVEIEENLGAAWLDDEKLQHAVINLLSNACKFTQDGTVRVRARRLRLEDRDLLEVSVIDTGIGIAPETRARLFEPFTQGDESLAREYEGAGVGLAITNKLVQLMGGKIRVESEPGKGSTFTILIPTEFRLSSV